MKKVVETPKIFAKLSVEDAKKKNALTGPAHRPGEKGEKNKKTLAPFSRRKNVFLRKSCVFACLGHRHLYRTTPPKPPGGGREIPSHRQGRPGPRCTCSSALRCFFGWDSGFGWGIHLSSI
jgi:hypothetical protein